MYEAGKNLRLQIKNLVNEFINNMTTNSPPENGLTTAKIFRECGLDWDTYENVTTTILVSSIITWAWKGRQNQTQLKKALAHSIVGAISILPNITSCPQRTIIVYLDFSNLWVYLWVFLLQNPTILVISAYCPKYFIPLDAKWNQGVGAKSSPFFFCGENLPHAMPHRFDKVLKNSIYPLF